MVVITGNADNGFAFRHADGAGYGQPGDATGIELAKQAFDILCGLGFKMTQAQKLIETVQCAGPPATLEAFVQAALRAT